MYDKKEWRERGGGRFFILYPCWLLARSSSWPRLNIDREIEGLVKKYKRGKKKEKKWVSLCTLHKALAK